jgi:hypothetical protein
MDPQAALTRLIESALESDDPNLSDTAHGLISWHARGGFLPDLKLALDRAVEKGLHK